MRIVSYIFTTLFLLFFTIFGVIIYVLWHYGKDLPEYRKLAKYEPSVVTRVHAGNGALLVEFAKQKRVFVPIDVIPQKIINAFLSAEDKDFYHHFGIDLQATLRALIVNVKNYGSGRRLVGASTITQQVAKNFLLTSEVSFERKIKEAILAIRIERAFSKNQILELYLNEIYLGNNSYGVAAAALNYFDKSLDDLTTIEAAFLATLPKAPSKYNPKRNYNRTLERRNWVLKQMKKNRFINENEFKEFKKQDINIKSSSGLDLAYAPYFSEEVRRIILKNFGSEQLYEGGLSIRTTLDPKLQKFAEQALADGLEDLDKRQGWRGPIKNINYEGKNIEEIKLILSELQKGLPKNRFIGLVQNVLKDKVELILENGKKVEIKIENNPWLKNFKIIQKKNNKRLFKKSIKNFKKILVKGDIILLKNEISASGKFTYKLNQIPKVNGAIVVMDPNTGRILALSGGYRFLSSEFNRATQAKRQPGSAFKPFVYLAALDMSIKPTELILDAPLSYDQGAGLPKWKPANYTKKFYGPSPMRLGIEKSRNLMTARLALLVKMEKIKSYAKTFGINENLPNLLSMSLGAGETTLLKLTNAYGMIINGGKKIVPSFIDRVQDRRGKTISKNDMRNCVLCNSFDSIDERKIPKIKDDRSQVTDPGSAYQMVSMLRGAVIRGTGRLVNKINKTLGGKTGTTNNNTDAWFIGFSSDLVVGVYVGFDKPKSLGEKETGSSVSAPIFRQFMSNALNNKTDIPFRRPSGIKLIKVNPQTGLMVNSKSKHFILEAFKPGQLPSLTTDLNFQNISKQKNVIKRLSPLY